MYYQAINMEEFDRFSEDEKWNAVVSRDASWDGRVFYGVTTTGIYCVPSCPSKRPARTSVRFFSGNEDAQAAGFRPCKRCKPEDIAARLREISMVMEVLESMADEITSPSRWASSTGLTLDALRKLTTVHLGLSPRAVINHRKMEAFKSAIRDGNGISSSQFDAGFGSSSRLYEKASIFLGMTPGQYKEKGRNVKIKYAIFDTRLGQAVIAGTEKGICSLQFADNREQLLETLREDFFEAELEENHEALTGWIRMLNTFLDGDGKELPIPLDVHATVFRARVWEAIRRIPYGETRSYSRLAEEIGKPSAARAVASACAANPVALVTPCHRVVHEDGTISGYRWGIHRKKALLSMEKENI